MKGVKQRYKSIKLNMAQRDSPTPTPRSLTLPSPGGRGFVEKSKKKKHSGRDPYQHYTAGRDGGEERI
jgi:hypothetical protein